MAPTLQEARRRFPSVSEGIYFDHASVGPISTDVASAMRTVLAGHESRGFQYTWRDEAEAARAEVARLVGSDASSIAFAQNTSFGLSLVANGLGWTPGDNVVLPALEFPSNFCPWINLRRQGVEVRLVGAPHGHVDVEDVRAAVDDRTRVVAISAVQFSTGYRYDLGPLADLADDGPLLVVDGTQSVGAVATDVVAQGIDVLAVSSHKWLMGPPGAGFVHMAARARDRVRPSVVGWLSVPDPLAFDYNLTFGADASRYEPGTENLVGNIGLGAAAALMNEFTPAWVEARVLELTDQLVDGLRSRGCEVLSDRDTKARSGSKDGSAALDGCSAGWQRAGERLGRV
jgi:selenocysteine lyase/cysteine desulfurase